MKKRIIKILVNNRIRRISKVYDRKIEQMHGAKLNVDDSLISLHKQKWASLSNHPVNISWLNAYVNSTKIESPDFVPESVFYTMIEPILNISPIQLAYADKNFFDLVFPQNFFPATVLRNINGGFYADNYSALNIKTNEDFQTIILKNTALIVKPAIESGGGENVYLFKNSGNEMIDGNGKILNLTFLQTHLQKNYIIQKLLSQHHDLGKFNKTSINTIRLLSWLSPATGDVEILQCVLRVGAHGQYIDNIRRGGYTIGVRNDGFLNQFATNKIGEHFTEINGVSLLQKHKIPILDEIKEKAKEISSKFLYSRLIGLDMTVDENQIIRCIEINNSSNGINFYQLNNGPLFGEFTNEVIDYCVEHKQRIYESYTI